jgi:hypothetical protein
MPRTILSVTIGCALLASMTHAAEDASPRESDLAGMYACEGTNPNGSPYSALVEIVKVDKTYLVKWIQPNGTEVLGVGIQKGTVLSVSYFGSAPAIVVYSVEADGRLDGQWTMGGADGEVFAETLTKLKIGAEPKPPRPTRRPASPRWGVNI